MATQRDHTTKGGGIGRHRNKQPQSHEDGIKMKNPKLNNPDMRSYKGWNRPDTTWYAASDITDTVKSGEHEVTWTVHILCKIMIGATKRRRIQKPNKGANKMKRITKQNQRPILDTNKEELKS